MRRVIERTVLEFFREKCERFSRPAARQNKEFEPCGGSTGIATALGTMRRSHAAVLFVVIQTIIVMNAWPAGAQDADENPPEAGPFTWSTPAPGFEVAELPVLEKGAEVERLHLTRIDPARFKFEVHTAPNAAREIETWMKVTGAVMIVNGSYFDQQGNPSTPVISRGHTLGPKAYGTKHGAFVVLPDGPKVLDLKRTRWQTAFRGATEAMVSFPILIGADGNSRAHNSNPDLLANRSFIGQDRAGRIIVGTTHASYFSLDRFADFLAVAELDMSIALNLDGGQLACQGVAIGTFRRSVCSMSEGSAEAAHLRVLGQLLGHRPWGLPIVLAVFPK